MLKTQVPFNCTVCHLWVENRNKSSLLKVIYLPEIAVPVVQSAHGTAGLGSIPEHIKITVYYSAIYCILATDIHTYRYIYQLYFYLVLLLRGEGRDDLTHPSFHRSSTG
jgi:hypothetical protein